MGTFCISESIALNIFVVSTKNKLPLPLWCRPVANLLFHFLKLIGYLASAVNLISSNPCAGPSPRIKISFPLLSTCTDELK